MRAQTAINRPETRTRRFAGAPTVASLCGWTVLAAAGVARAQDPPPAPKPAAPESAATSEEAAGQEEPKAPTEERTDPKSSESKPATKEPQQKAAAEAPSKPPLPTAAKGNEEEEPGPSQPPPKDQPEDDGQEPSALEKRIDAAQKSAKKLNERIWLLEGRHTLTVSQAGKMEDQVNAWAQLLASFKARATRLEQRKQTSSPDQQADVLAEEEGLRSEVKSTETALEAIEDELKRRETENGFKLVGTLLHARCQTAFCFDLPGRKYWLGVEPLVELPIGKSFALSDSSLTDYVNNHDLRVDLAAGVRVWLFRDVVSLSLYISKPLTDARVRLKGSRFVYPASSVRRPYPGVALGLLFDSIWVGFDRDELRNGDGQDGTSINPDFPPNEAISSTWTLTVALQPVTAFRTAIGTAVQATKGDPK